MLELIYEEKEIAYSGFYDRRTGADKSIFISAFDRNGAWTGKMGSWKWKVDLNETGINPPAELGRLPDVSWRWAK